MIITAFTGLRLLALILFRWRILQKVKRSLTVWQPGEYAVIYITEQLAAQLSAEISKYSEELMPAIIQIPGISGNTGAGIENVKKSVETAVGSDILFSNE